MLLDPVVCQLRTGKIRIHLQAAEVLKSILRTPEPPGGVAVRGKGQQDSLDLDFSTLAGSPIENDPGLSCSPGRPLSENSLHSMLATLDPSLVDHAASARD